VAKFSVITSFLGSVKNRFITYQDDCSLEDKFLKARKIVDLDGLELCYPADFSDFKLLKRLIKDSGLGVSAINFRSRRTGAWLRGSFSSSNEKERSEVIDDAKRAMDYAAELGCERVSSCLLNEGSDYLFEMDYEKAYMEMTRALAEVAAYNPELDFCIEYKLSDPRGRSLIGNMGEILTVCNLAGAPNLGINLDIGHSLYAGERPAQALALAVISGRPLYIHLNDNDKFWDWDMVPGAFNLLDFLEFFYCLNRTGYDGWFGMDIFSKEIDTVKTYSFAISITKRMMAMAKKLDDDKIAELRKKRNPIDSMEYLYSILT